jgi:hypothetical protein
LKPKGAFSSRHQELSRSEEAGFSVLLFGFFHSIIIDLFFEFQGPGCLCSSRQALNISLTVVANNLRKVKTVSS